MTLLPEWGILETSVGEVLMTWVTIAPSPPLAESFGAPKRRRLLGRSATFFISQVSAMHPNQSRSSLVKPIVVGIIVIVVGGIILAYFTSGNKKPERPGLTTFVSSSGVIKLDYPSFLESAKESHDNTVEIGMQEKGSNLLLTNTSLSAVCAASQRRSEIKS